MSMMLPQGGPPPTISVPRQGGGTPGEASPDAGGTFEDDINTALDALRSALTKDADHEDKLAASKMETLAQQILTTQQKQDEAAMGTTPAHKAVKRATARSRQAY